MAEDFNIQEQTFTEVVPRLEGESTKAYRALMDFAFMGVARQQRDLFNFYRRKYGTNSRMKPAEKTIYAWSKEFNWSLRLNRWDDYEAQQLSIRHQRDRDAFLDEVEADARDLYRELKRKVADFAKFLQPVQRQVGKDGAEIVINPGSSTDLRNVVLSAGALMKLIEYGSGQHRQKNEPLELLQALLVETKYGTRSPSDVSNVQTLLNDFLKDVQVALQDVNDDVIDVAAKD